MNPKFFIVVILISKIMTEEKTTLQSWPLKPTSLPDETRTERFVTGTFPTDSVIVDFQASTKPQIDEWQTTSYDENILDKSFYAEYWNEEWPDIWRVTEYFPFYSTLKDRQDLLEKVMLGYNKHILPYSGNNFFNISINISLIAVGEIDEIEEKMSTVLWLIYEWKDDNINWNQYESYVTDLTLGWSEVWKPVLRVDNPHADSSNRQATERSYDSVIYSPDGTASFDEMMVARTTCDLDMTYYPFDIQVCMIKLSVIGSSKFPFKLNIKLEDDLTSSDTKHGSWKLLHKGTHIFPKYFQIELMFERRPLFILLNILLPIIVIALLTPTVFILPKKSGERVGFAITMLLALSVYMTIVSDHLPQNSEPMPLILIMMFIWYIIDAIIVFIVIINSRINRMKASKPLPNLLRSFVLTTHKLLYRTKNKSIGINSCDKTMKCLDPTKAVKGNEIETDADKENVQQENCTKEDEEDRSLLNIEVNWQAVSHCIDRWCFLICYLIKIILPVAFFVVMKCESRNQM